MGQNSPSLTLSIDKASNYGWGLFVPEALSKFLKRPCIFLMFRWDHILHYLEKCRHVWCILKYCLHSALALLCICALSGVAVLYCMSLSQCVCQWLALYLGAVTASVNCLRDIRDHVCSATSKRAETPHRPQGLGVDNVTRLRAGDAHWHMLSDRKMSGCCRAGGEMDRWPIGLTAVRMDSVCARVCGGDVTRTGLTFRPHSWGQNGEVTLFCHLLLHKSGLSLEFRWKPVTV